MSRAVTGIYPDMTLNYAQVQVSRGRLPGAINALAIIRAEGVIEFSFDNNSTDGIASPNDTVVVVAYAPDLQQAMFTLWGGLRKNGKASLNVALFKGYTVETWIGFLNKDETDASDSTYTGRIEV